MIDHHHILHTKGDWSRRGESLYLRGTPSLVPRIERDAHNEIHRECPSIPVLGFHALQRVSRTFDPIGNTMRDIELLQLSIDKGTKHPKTHPIERSMAELTLHAIDLQKPFLQEALSERKFVA